MRRLLLALAISLGLAASLIAIAAACTIDGKPSAFANGVRAVIYTQAPTAATYSWWARFAFPRAVRVGQRVALHEDDAQVRKVLPLADLRKSWRWEFGDQSSMVGDRVTHVYTRPGKYKIAVEAYFSTYGWQAFDSVTITVRR